MNTVQERAWAAGFWDGEGCTGMYGSRFRLHMTQKEREPLDRFVAVIGGKVNGPYRPKGHCTRYNYVLSGDPARTAIAKLLPLLGEAKRDQAERKLGIYRYMVPH